MRSKSKFVSSSESSLSRSSKILSDSEEEFQEEQICEEFSEQIRQQFHKSHRSCKKQRDDIKSRSKHKKKCQSQQKSKTMSKKLKQNYRRITQLQQMILSYRKTKRQAEQKFYQPFQKHTLNTNRQQLVEAIKGAAGKENPNETKLIGIKKQKIIFKWKVCEQFRYAIDYLENDFFPGPLKIEFECLLKGTTPTNRI